MMSLRVWGSYLHCQDARFLPVAQSQRCPLTRSIVPAGAGWCRSPSARRRPLAWCPHGARIVPAWWPSPGARWCFLVRPRASVALMLLVPVWCPRPGARWRPLVPPSALRRSQPPLPWCSPGERWCPRRGARCCRLVPPRADIIAFPDDSDGFLLIDANGGRRGRGSTFTGGDGSPVEHLGLLIFEKPIKPFWLGEPIILRGRLCLVEILVTDLARWAGESVWAAGSRTSQDLRVPGIVCSRFPCGRSSA